MATCSAEMGLKILIGNTKMQDQINFNTVALIILALIQCYTAYLTRKTETVVLDVQP